MSRHEAPSQSRSATIHEHHEPALEVVPEIMSCLGRTPTGGLLRESLEAQGVKLPAFTKGAHRPVELFESVETAEPEATLRGPNSSIDLLLEAASL